MQHLRGTRTARTVAVVFLLLVQVASITSTSPASGQESASQLQARMDSIQARLDAATSKIEALRTEKDELEHRIEDTRAQLGTLSDRVRTLKKEAAQRAAEIYMAGTSTMVEALLSAESISDVMDRAEALSHVSDHETGVFVELVRATAELSRLKAQLADERRNLLGAESNLANESKRLQAQFAEVKAEYEKIAKRLAPEQTSSSSSASAPLLRSTDGMYCPVGGPTSFVDSWGAPRSGHTHQGVDMMGSYGTPLVAIVSGTITYAAYDGSGGNMLFLSGSDGNQYWYMHNQENFVSTGAHVGAGETIASLGDTGNAAGTPHLHFEYHPGGGAAVNPYPLVASIC